ncbi:DUF4870 domain-containing protein [Specibacter sp. NPDC057265]|uniref:DUF4870 domain-containing protein n=1 Tax=Specibacter sp. NPDC057265 TaxID=3346075 RepID=UPI003634D230
MSENSTPTPPVGPTPPGYDAPASHQQPVQHQQPYQQPVQHQQPYQQGATDPAGTVTLNYWLSVFFSWIPALVFFLTEKGKNGLVDDVNKQNLNFSILRGIAGFLWVIVPGVGFIFGLAALALFVIHILAAVEAPKKLRSGQPYRFPFNVPFIK